MTALQTFDGRQQVVLDHPGQIQPGDWLPDLGTLRQVKSVDTIGVGAGDSAGVVHILHFFPQRGVSNLARGISGGTRELTVWRKTYYSQPPFPSRTGSARSGPAEEAPRDLAREASSQPAHQGPPADVSPPTRVASAGDPPPPPERRALPS